MSDVQRIISSRQHYDEIAGLVERLESIPAEQSTAIHALSSCLVQVFGQLAKEGVFMRSQKTVDEITTREWLEGQQTDFENVILQLVGSENPVTAKTAFEAAMRLVKIYGKYEGVDCEPVVAKLFIASLFSKSDLFEECWRQYLVYDDIRYYVFKVIPPTLKEFAANVSKREIEALMDTLLSIDSYPTDDDEIETFYAGTPRVHKSKSSKGNLLKLSSQKLSCQRAWLAALELRLNANQLKQILSVLHTKVLPNMAKPQLLMDFLTDAYTHGGSIALLALNSLFMLIQEYNLDYPKFFTQLYALLADGSILVSSHRARFLRLLDLFMTSTHLPATIVASFVKRLARLSLFAPPGAIVAIVPFIYNQLKRTPTCMLMIHRDSTVRGPECDPFNPDEPDPLLSRAIDSSLWEIDTLTGHYHPNVAALAKIMSQPFRKPSYQLEHFLAHSYETLFATESKRKGRGPAALEYEEVQVFDDPTADTQPAYLGGWTI